MFTEVLPNLLVISRQLNFLLLIVFEEVMLFFFAWAFAQFSFRIVCKIQFLYQPFVGLAIELSHYTLHWAKNSIESRLEIEWVA